MSVNAIRCCMLKQARVQWSKCGKTLECDDALLFSKLSIPTKVQQKDALPETHDWDRLQRISRTNRIMFRRKTESK